MQAPRKYVDRFAHIERADQRVYYGMIAALDDAVGAILASLAELHLDENTIVVFLSDNGAASYTGIMDNAPLKGGKLTNFEGGINVPFLLRWPRERGDRHDVHAPGLDPGRVHDDRACGRGRAADRSPL